MASRKKVDSNATLSNVKTKVEPGTSTAPLLRNIKIEPGQPVSTTRLTSFRVPRDLTLGASVKTEKPKKVYTPNINVQRNKKKDDGTTVKKEIKPARGRGRGRGQADRGRGRGKTPSNLIQSTGVFSEGINDVPRAPRRSGGYHDSSNSKRDSAALMEKPLLNLNQNIDKAEEEEKIKSLLRDDFIDDDDMPMVDDVPIALPLIDEGKSCKSEIKSEIKVQGVSEEEEIDVKPIILSNGEAVMPAKSSQSHVKPCVDQKDSHTAISQIMENQTNSYMLIQLPDCLPGLRTSEEPTDPRLRRQSDQNPPASAIANVGKSEFCTLGSLKGGLLGKIQICKSGKARFLVGNNTMLIDLGSRLSFRQDLIATKIDESNNDGEIVNLGRIINTLICSPDWETMLASL